MTSNARIMVFNTASMNMRNGHCVPWNAAVEALLEILTSSQEQFKKTLCEIERLIHQFDSPILIYDDRWVFLWSLSDCFMCAEE